MDAFTKACDTDVVFRSVLVSTPAQAAVACPMVHQNLFSLSLLAAVTTAAEEACSGLHLPAHL